MVWKSPGKCDVMDKTEKKRRWIIQRRLKGWKVQDIATAVRTNEKYPADVYFRDLRDTS